MTLQPMIMNPTSQVNVAVDPITVVEYAAVDAFATTGGRPQSETKQ